MIEYNVSVNGIKVNAVYSERTVNDLFIPLLKKLSEMQREKGSRILVMLAAPPGAGKSTLLSFLEMIAHEQRDIDDIQVIGMDGFHRRQEYLQTHYVMRNGKQIPMVDIKGAPVTFDLDKLTERVRKVASGGICSWPVYDRMLHDPIEDVIRIDGDIVILEGNYLLLDEEGWRELHNYADYTITITAEEVLLRKRLIDRRIKTGVEEEAATRFVDYSDMPNVRLCLTKTMLSDLQLTVDRKSDITAVRSWRSGFRAMMELPYEGAKEMKYKIRKSEEDLIALFSERRPFSEHFDKWEDELLPDKYDQNFFEYRGQPTREEFAKAKEYQKKIGAGFIKLEGREPLTDSFGLEESVTLTMLHIKEAKWTTNPDLMFCKPSVKELEDLDVKHFGALYGEDFTRRNIHRLYEKLTYVGAYLDGVLVGACYCFCKDSLTCIDGLIVDEEYRKRYIATSLIAYIKSRFPDSILYLHADEDDTPKEMYEKMGFKTVDKLYEYLCTDSKVFA